MRCGGEHAPVVVAEDQLGAPAERRDPAHRRGAHQDEGERERRLGQEELGAERHARRSSSNETTCRSNPLRLLDQPLHHGAAAHEAAPPGQVRVRPTMRSPTPVRAGEVDQRRERDPSDSRRTTSAPSSRALLDVGEQVALGLRVDAVGRLAGRLDVDDEPVGVEPPGHARAPAQERRGARRVRRQHTITRPALRGAAARSPAGARCARAVQALGDLAQRQLAQRREVRVAGRSARAPRGSCPPGRSCRPCSRSSRSSTARSRLTT